MILQSLGVTPRLKNEELRGIFKVLLNVVSDAAFLGTTGRNRFFAAADTASTWSFLTLNCTIIENGLSAWPGIALIRSTS